MEIIFTILIIILGIIYFNTKVEKRIYRTKKRFHEITGIREKRHQRTEFSSTSKTYIDEKGYRRFTNSDDLVHRWKASKKIGRKLRKKEVVHHIDHNKLNNSPENLYVCRNQREHEKIHSVDSIRKKNVL